MRSLNVAAAPRPIARRHDVRCRGPVYARTHGSRQGHRQWQIDMKGNRTRPNKPLFGAAGAWAICRP